jgi:ribokinase
MIVVFGSINIDLVTRVEHLPGPGETVLGASFTLSPGGKGANQALAARRAGAEVALVGAVGRDPFAAPALHLLQKGGVDIGHVRRSAGAPTGLATIAVDAHGANQIVVAAGANAEAEAAWLPDALLGPATTLLVQMELPPAEVAAAVAHAKARGARVVLNLAPAAMLPEAVLDGVDLLVLNAGEARALARAFALHVEDAPDLAEALGRRRGAAVVVTAGPAGAYHSDGAALAHQPAPAVEVIDSTGAGDAFTGVVAAALDAGLPLAEAVRRGVAAGALACGHAGAQPSLPSADLIDRLAASLAAAPETPA